MKKAFLFWKAKQSKLQWVNWQPKRLLENELEVPAMILVLATAGGRLGNVLLQEVKNEAKRVDFSPNVHFDNQSGVKLDMWSISFSIYFH